MTNSTFIRITRRGFLKAPANVREQAQSIVSGYASSGDPCPGARVIAELRLATYLGPGSPGDRGAYTLYISSNFATSELRTLEAA